MPPKGGAGGKAETKEKHRSVLSSSATAAATGGRQNINEPLRLQQQKCLDIFRDAFRPGPEDQEVLRAVKGHLYNRDFAAAFGKDDYLRVYASRWSPSRALAYIQVFKEIEGHLKLLEPSVDAPLTITCIGGGAGGELVGLAAWFSLLDESGGDATSRLRARLLDIADWAHTTAALEQHITTAPELSKYASPAKRDANKPLLSSDVFSVTFEQQDALALTQHPEVVLTSQDASFTDTTLVTFMFTLNELYSTSTAKTQQLLALLTSSMTPGSCLLVVDSPGSYSTISINGGEKKYPMHWLLEHALLGSPANREDESVRAKWEKLVSNDSKWFRLDRSLQYPIDLEDMRYQIHLYRRLSDVGG